MPIPTKFLTVLKESLKDVKLGEESAINVLNGYYDQGNKILTLETSVSKLENANNLIVSEREDLKNNLKESKDSNKRLLENQLTEEDKNAIAEYKKKGMTTEVEAKLNQFKETIEGLRGDLKSSNDKVIEKEQSEKQASFKNAVTTLNSNLVAQLTAKGFTGSKLKAVMGIIDQDGLAKVNSKEDGSFEKHIIKLNKDNEPVATDETGLITYLESTYPEFIQASGTPGTGTQHSNGSNNTNNTDLFSSQHKQDQFVSDVFSNMIDHHKKE